MIYKITNNSCFVFQASYFLKRLRKLFLNSNSSQRTKRKKKTTTTLKYRRTGVSDLWTTPRNKVSNTTATLLSGNIMAKRRSHFNWPPTERQLEEDKKYTYKQELLQEHPDPQAQREKINACFAGANSCSILSCASLVKKFRLGSYMGSQVSM